MDEFNFGKILLFGEKGRFSESFKQVISNENNSTAVTNLSSRESATPLFQIELQKYLDTKDLLSNYVIWSSGSSNARSSKNDCKIDKDSLVNNVRMLNQYSKNPQNFCFLSSGGAIYGRSPGIVSELSPANPETFYGEMKLECEQFLQREKELGNINLKILRLANAYGSDTKGLNRNLVDVVLNESTLKLSAKTTSVKQYGTFEDYSRNILRFLGSTAYKENDEVIKNIFPHHQYSIGKIIELVDTLRPGNNKIIVDFVSQKLSEETVILQNSNGSETSEDSWESLENYLSRKFPSRL